MKNSGDCPKCHSTALIPDVTVVDYSRSQFAGNMQLVFERNPKALVFKDKMHAGIKAWVCGNCGHLELYTDKHHELLEAYQERLAYTEMDEEDVPHPSTKNACPECGHKLANNQTICPHCADR